MHSMAWEVLINIGHAVAHLYSFSQSAADICNSAAPNQNYAFVHSRECPLWVRSGQSPPVRPMSALRQ